MVSIMRLFDDILKQIQASVHLFELIVIVLLNFSHFLTGRTTKLKQRIYFNTMPAAGNFVPIDLRPDQQI
jgi:hypothetical protein